MQDIYPFLDTDVLLEYTGENVYNPFQWGAKIKPVTNDQFDLDQVVVVLVGCGEWRGEEDHVQYVDSAQAIRKELYAMYHWHEGIEIGDLGNIRQGSSANDSAAALRMVLQSLDEAGKLVVIIGGSHDLTLQQYEVFKRKEQLATATIADLFIDLQESESLSAKGFLMDMFTDSPNFLAHFNLVGFQSYYAHPKMLETLDKLRFDFYRVGRLKENIEEIEPVIRDSDFFSFDISCIKYSEAPANIKGSPNGLTGEEACILARFAGMSEKLSTFGIYGLNASLDRHNMTAKLIAQMLWYFVDGIHLKRSEATLDMLDEFFQYHVSFTENDTLFLKSKRTGRWWMKMQEGVYVPCTYSDYVQASNNDMPERWLRYQERLM